MRSTLASFRTPASVGELLHVTLSCYACNTDPVQSAALRNEVRTRRTSLPREPRALHGTTWCPLGETAFWYLATFSSYHRVAIAALNQPQPIIDAAYYMKKRSHVSSERGGQKGSYKLYWSSCDGTNFNYKQRKIISQDGIADLKMERRRAGGGRKISCDQHHSLCRRLRPVQV